MKKFTLTLLYLCITIFLNAQVSKTLNLTAGTLSTELSAEELSTVTDLTLTGSIDARDFKTMRDDMPLLAEIDLSEVTISEYSGTEGTYWEVGVIITYPANEIPIFAFQNQNFCNTSLTSVILPVNTNSIGWDAFCCVTNLTSIVIPPTITHIGVAAFAGCPFSTVTIPSSVIQIDVVAFSGSNYIIVEPDNPNYCSVDGVLYNKDKTTLMQCPYSKTGSYIIPPTVNRIDDHAFEYCRELTSVEIPSSVKSISHFAFLACVSLNSITIPSQVTYLGDWVFADCIGLTSIYSQTLMLVNLSNSKEVFQNVNKTTCTLYVPYGTKTLYKGANLWKDFESIVEAGEGFLLSANTASVTAAEGSASTVDITANVGWTAVSDQGWLSVSPESGNDNQTLTFTAEANPSIGTRKATVTVSATGFDSQTVTVTQDGSNIPVNVTAGGLKALFTSEELNSITKLTLTGTLDARDFKTMRDDMPLLAEIDLSGVTILTYNGPDGTSIWGNDYYQADAIPEFAFLNENWISKISLTSIVFPESVLQINQFAFYGNRLSSLSLPLLITSIQDYAFAFSGSINSINIPSSVTTIGSWTFYGCTSTTLISIPLSVNFIGEAAFDMCGGLITVDENNLNYSSFDGVLFNKDKTILMSCPISKSANYDILLSVVKIAYRSFFCCNNLTSLTIPSSVKTIETNAFFGCSGLTSIYAQSSFPVNLSSSIDVFLYVDKTNCILHVPYGAKAAYQAANQWQEFANIVEDTDGFNLSASTVNFAAAGGSESNMYLSANVDWTVSSDQPWLTVSPESGNDNQTLTFTAEANTSIGTRKATVTVSATNFESQAITVTQDGSNVPVNVTAGGLKALFTTEELNSVTKLTLIGTIDARDFKTMRDDMPLLAELDLSGITVSAYSGTDGTAWYVNYYPSNEISELAFYSLDTYLGKASLTSVTLPTSVTSIGHYSFQGCIGMVNFIIPSSVTSIEDGAFMLCGGLTSVTIPKTVNHIGNWAFQFCGSLSSIIANPSYPVDLTSSLDVFNGVEKYLCTLSVPYGSKELYTNANQWQDFTNIVEPEFGFALGSSTVNLGALEGSSASVAIKANVSWTATSNQSWLIVDSGTGTSDGSIILTAKANDGLPRIALVTVTSSGFEAQTILVNQDCTGTLSNSNLIYNGEFTNEGNPSPWWYYSNTGGTEPKVINGVVNIFPGSATSDYWNDGFGQGYKNAEPNIDYVFSFTAWSNSNRTMVVAFNDNQENNYNRYGRSSDPEAENGRSQWWVNLTSTPTVYTFHVNFDQLKENSTQTLVYYFSTSESTVFLDHVSLVRADALNRIPVANAGSNRDASEGTLVTLDGSASFDLDGDALTYLWTAPAGITLSSVTASQPTFVSPKVKINTDFTFSLVVNDGTTNSQADEVVITVLRKDNKAPFADGGKNQSVDEGTLVTLDGSASSDKDGDPLTYLWTAPEGVTLSANNVAQPTFLAPLVDKDTHLTFSLVVNDGYLDSKLDFVTIKIINKMGKKSAEIISEVAELENPVLKAYPNPFSDRLYIEVSSTGNSDVSLDIFDAKGSKLRSQSKGKIASEGTLRFEFVPNGITSQLLMYKLTINKEAYIGKVIYRK